MRKTEDLEMESGDSYMNTYANMRDLDVQRMRRSPRNNAAKNTRCRVIKILLILGFLILVFLVSLLFIYYSDLMSKVTGWISNEQVTGSAHPICGAEWTKYGLSCYYLSLVSKPWTSASKDCEDRNAHLVVINGEGEMDFLRDFSKVSQVWIGLSDADGIWRWVDGTSYDMTPKFWDVNQPDNWKDHVFGGGEDCVELRDRNKWNDNHCFRRLRYICEKKIF